MIGTVGAQAENVGRLNISKAQAQYSFANIEFACEDLDCIEGKPILVSKAEASKLPVLIEGDWDYVIEVKYKGDTNRALDRVTGYLGCSYSTPYIAADVIVWKFPNEKKESEENAVKSNVSLYGLGFLPPSIESFICKYPNTQYSPRAEEVTSNLGADEAKVNWYLGNYFPRSFCEAFAIFDYILDAVEVPIGDDVSILDIGIGSGGATAGLIWALRKRAMSRIKKITVVGYDGNEYALARCKDLLSSCDMKIELKLVNELMSEKTFCSLNYESKKFNFVLCSKAVQEIAPLKYDLCVSFMNKMLKPKGVALLLEILNEKGKLGFVKAIKAFKDISRLLIVAGVEKPATFGVISNLTGKSMEENIMFGVWGGAELSYEESLKVEVTMNNKVLL